MMLKKILPVLALLALPVMFAGCTQSTTTQESTGQFVDDSAITTKVKAAILGDAGLKGFQIMVLLIEAAHVPVMNRL